MKVYEAAENYLEAILMISKQKQTVRAADICRFFGYSRPTVSAMIKQLRENGYVSVDNENLLTLTEKGMGLASDIYERHMIISKLLMFIGVTEETAFDDACKIEHDISASTFECLKKAVQQLDGKRPDGGTVI